MYSTVVSRPASAAIAPGARARPNRRASAPRSAVAASRPLAATSLVPASRSTAIRRSEALQATLPARASVVARAASSAAPAPAAGEDTGETTAMINTVKAIFGAGGFSLPWAYAQGGTVLVTACLACSLVFGLESLRMLVKAQETLVEGKVVSGQADVQTYAGLTGAALGPAGDTLCKVLNVITCFGISVGYMIFVSDTAISMLPAAKQVGFTTAKMIINTLPLWVGLAWQRSFKGVNLISLMGTASVALGMVWVMVVALSNPLQMAAIPTSNPSAFSGFFGTVAFLFFIHFTLFGVQEGMPEAHRKRFLPAASKAFYLSALISVAFGVIGAFGFGPEVKSVVITMLPGAAGIAVKALMCINLLFTFPLMARSCLVILENAFGVAENVPVSLAVRSAFVIGAGSLACVVPNFGTVLGYVGGFCCCAMTLAMPPVILHKAMVKAGEPAKGMEMARIVTVCAVGLVCMALSVLL